MKSIQLTQGHHATVDKKDFKFLNQWKWRALKAKRKNAPPTWYAIRTTPRPNRKCVYMHREVMRLRGFTEFSQVDHRDGSGLNNQRKNLRAATAPQNHWNRRKGAGCTSQFKGVYWHKKLKIWMARIYCLGKHYYLGIFKKEKDAAKAYDAASVLHFGEFARLNLSK